MCGIIGYLGEEDVTPILLNGLTRLQYRGYDSAGICLLDNGKLKSFKKKGKIEELKKELKDKGGKSSVGIAHTRWATHGEPNEVNAHPHFSCNNELAIVHNGIIENYATLKKMLQTEGHNFTSETDSEVLAHLIEKFYSGDLERAVISALELVEGAYGIAVIHKDKRQIVAARKGSPLILGIGEKGTFVCSDVTAILEHTRNVIYLEDGEIVVIEDSNYVVRNLKQEEITKEIHKVKLDLDKIEKGGYEHFMLKEIFEQPSSLENLLRGKINDGDVKLSLNFDIQNIRRIVIIACGTSWHSGLIAKHFIEQMTRIPVEVDYASEFRYRNPLVGPEDLVIAVSQSGETADTLGAVREAKIKGATVMGIVNVVNSTIARETDSGIYLHAGPEIGVASTKAFSSQVLALLLFALYCQKKQTGSIDLKIVNAIAQLKMNTQRVLDFSEKIRDVSNKYSHCSDFLYLGRGINSPVALEGALKLKEISYIHAEGYPAAEMKHGPIALIEKGFPCVFVISEDQEVNKVISNIEEVKARGANIICISDFENSKLKELCDDLILVPKVHEYLSPIINNIPLQILAYHIANSRGIDVDKPRNLAKSVTVE